MHQLLVFAVYVGQF